MRRGTTPTFTFRLKDNIGQAFDTSIISDIRVTFKQGDKIVVEKKLKDCEFSGNAVAIILTQKDTLLFDHSKTVRIQIKMKDRKTGKIIPTKIRSIPVTEILNEEVL